MVNGERQRRVCPCAATNKSDKDKSVNGLRGKAYKVKEKSLGCCSSLFTEMENVPLSVQSQVIMREFYLLRGFLGLHLCRHILLGFGLNGLVYWFCGFS